MSNERTFKVALVGDAWVSKVSCNLGAWFLALVQMITLFLQSSYISQNLTGEFKDDNTPTVNNETNPLPITTVYIDERDFII